MLQMFPNLKKENSIGWITTKGQVKSHWIAIIRIGNIRKYLGSFKTEQEAHEAYKIACKQLSLIGDK